MKNLTATKVAWTQIGQHLIQSQIIINLTCFWYLAAPTHVAPQDIIAALVLHILYVCFVQSYISEVACDTSTQIQDYCFMNCNLYMNHSFSFLLL